METVIFWGSVLLVGSWTVGWFEYRKSSISYSAMIVPVLMLWGVMLYFYRSPDLSKFDMLWAMPAALVASLFVTTPYLRWRNAGNSVFSFFKRSVSVQQYCHTRLDIIFGEEQTGLWTSLRTESSDAALSRADQQVYLDEMRGAHLQLLSLAITKQYSNFEIAMEVESCIRYFLAKTGNSKLEEVKRAYNQAFGSSSSDGVLQMVRLFSNRVAEGALSQKTVAEINDIFYSGLISIYGDFEQVKLVVS